MTTTGEFLLSISSLESGATAIEHLESVTGGETIVIGEDNINVEEDQLSVDILIDNELLANVEEDELFINLENDELIINIEVEDEQVHWG